MKVLHVVESINRGAVENWLLRMLRFGVCHGAALDWTFYCALGEKGQGDEERASLARGSSFRRLHYGTSSPSCAPCATSSDAVATM